MTKIIRKALGLALMAGLVVTTSGCDAFLEITNTGELEKEGVDPERDAQLLSQSVYQEFIEDTGPLALYTAWFTGASWVGDTFPTRNDFGRREVPWTNGHLEDFWENLSENTTFARTTAGAIEGAGPTIGLARVWFVSGYSILQMADVFCEGTIADTSVEPPEPRGPMTTAELLDTAIVDLQKAKQIGEQVGTEESEAVAMAAQVGIARAHLQAGNLSQAAAAAAEVPADFEFYLWHMDDPNNRNLANELWQFSVDRLSLVVPPAIRAIADAGDPRVAYFDEGRVAQDGVLNFFRQDKYQNYGDPELFASGLEAEYIAVEASQDVATIRTFVNERRAVGGEDPLTTSDMDVLMTELYRQRTLDFWLEDTKRWGDLRRNEQYMSFMIPPGEDTYYKPDIGVVMDQVCLPVPRDEVENNPNFGA